ncbi:MAG TPA: DUF1501 domain-containing protein [Symbiobacteriaceae bacterium]|nr:DUF1501 domain-containing protein [Symbiobacteriaceae bacterium]
MRLSRREFLVVSGGVLAALSLPRSAGAAALPVAAASGRSLVIIYLGGGNDGLNTVAPYGFGRYYDLRPTLGIKEQDALPLTGKLGLHPNLKGLKSLYDGGKLTVLQGVGYPNPDRSHFRSFDIWATGREKGVSPVGWLGRHLDLTDGAAPLRAVAVGAGVPKPLVGARAKTVAVESLELMQIKGAPASAAAIRAMYGAGAGDGGGLTVVRGKGQAAVDAADAVKALAAGYAPGAEYPKGRLAASLQLMVKLLAGGAGSELLYTTFGGFDEHAGEKGNHDRLMLEFDQAVTAFYRDLEAHGLADRVLTLVHSEFGRRAKENGSGGTDHGAAGPVFLLGGAVRGGLVGDHPDLADLLDGDLRMGIDFRSIYATLLEEWLGGSAGAVLGSGYERLPLIRA